MRDALRSLAALPLSDWAAAALTFILAPAIMLWGEWIIPAIWRVLS